MKLQSLPRWVLWGAALLTGAGIVAVSGSDTGSESEPLAKPVRRSAAAVAPVKSAAANEAARAPEQVAHLEIERLNPSEPAADAAPEVGNIFGATSWYVPPPPPPPPPPAPPPKPTAPPLPFTYLGQYDDTSSHVFILSKGDRIYTVSAGDVIDGTYRVEAPVGRAVVLTYLPLNITQSLAAGEG